MTQPNPLSRLLQMQQAAEGGSSNPRPSPPTPPSAGNPKPSCFGTYPVDEDRRTKCLPALTPDTLNLRTGEHASSGCPHRGSCMQATAVVRASPSPEAPRLPTPPLSPSPPPQVQTATPLPPQRPPPVQAPQAAAAAAAARIAEQSVMRAPAAPPQAPPQAPPPYVPAPLPPPQPVSPLGMRAPQFLTVAEPVVEGGTFWSRLWATIFRGLFKGGALAAGDYFDHNPLSGNTQKR